MLLITARTATFRLKIRKVMSRLFQSYVYSVIGPKEHAGYKHPSGKVFKATAFRIRYFDNRFEIEFTALNKTYEKQLAMDILQNGLKLGEVHFSDTTVSLIERRAVTDTLNAKGYVCAGIKDGDTNKKIYIEPRTAKHNEIIVNHSLQKYETLHGRPYEGELEILVTWQAKQSKRFYYQNGPVDVWMAEYAINAKSEFLNLLLDSGLGALGMQGLGYLEVVNGEK